MSRVEMTTPATVETGYEFYQTIIDFDHPIQIFREAFQNSVDEDATQVYCRVWLDQGLGSEDLYIDIWDNGGGLKRENAEAFFGLAKSTKVDKNKNPRPGKLGYKGHGTKIFFKSERVEICSKLRDGDSWGAVLDDAVKQIRESGGIKYSNILSPQELSISLPSNFQSGFYVRIKNPTHFLTQNTRFMLNHLYLRDYSKWFTVFGNIKTSFGTSGKEGTLYLQGLNIDAFANGYTDLKVIDPIPELANVDGQDFEKLQMGHYFPPQRTTEKEMRSYAASISQNKPFYEYYSKLIYREKLFLDINKSFDFLVSVEGYETKRRYDVLLSRRGPSLISKNQLHTDAERYGLWACKGGVPIEKVDDWIVGGRGVGTYTYMQAFIDCDAFELTGTRGSVRNTDIQILEKIKDKINEILSDSKIKRALAEREELEQTEKTLRSIEEDGRELGKRFKEAERSKQIRLPNGMRLYQPSKIKTGYSESETLVLLAQLLAFYPNLFPFKLLDYNTTKGIDFVIKVGEHPMYVELKGSMPTRVNHSFRNIDKFICYDLDMRAGDTLTDVEEFIVGLKVNNEDEFQSLDDAFKGKRYTSYQLQPVSANIKSMEILVLKRILEEVVGATLE